MAQKKTDDGLTPMMRQFYNFKHEHPDALLLFRCGDFYETYADDAVEAAKILGITLTRRSNGKTLTGQQPRWQDFHIMPSTLIFQSLFVQENVWPSATSLKTLSLQRLS